MSHVITAKIYDLGVTVLADISGIALEKSMTRQINGARSFTIQAPAGSTLLTTLAGDGDPNLNVGNRKLVVWEDSNPDTDDPIFHGRIFTVERDGDENAVLVTITAFDSWMELGFEADNRAGRPVRDDTQTLVGDPSFLTPSFSSSVGGQTEISGPDLIQQILTYSQADPTTNPIQGEGPLPIDLQSGTWDLLVPPALDISPIFDAVWPALCGDFIQQLIATNAVDFDLRPIRPGTGLDINGNPDDYIMVEASSMSKKGTDLSATVHFDYLTGDKNAIGCKETRDFSTYCDRLWYELGPRLSPRHWRGDLTPHSASVSDVLPLMDDAAAIYGGPDAAPGRFASFRVLDSLGSENSSRPLYIALYKDEVKLRVNPRQLLYVTPDPDTTALFEPPQDYDAFDLVQIKTGADFGVELDEKQRVYGYTKTWSREGVATVGQLVTSADAATGGGGGGGGVAVLRAAFTEH